MEFAIAFAVVLLARGSALFAINWTGDDYSLIFDPSGEGVIAANLLMMRSPVSIGIFFSHWFGAIHPTHGSFWTVLTAGSMVAFGLALRQLWLPGSAPIVGIITALIFALFPGQSNLFSYHLMISSMLLFYSLGAFALVSYAKGGWLTVLSVVAISLALGYQTMLSLFLVAGLFLPLFQLASLSAEADQVVAQAGWLRLQKNVSTYFAVLLSGVILYYLINKMLLVLTGAPANPRTALAGPELWSQKFALMVAHLKRMAGGNGEASLPSQIKALQIVLLAIGCLAWWQKIAQRPRAFKPPMWLQGFVLFGLLLLAACSVMVPAILLATTQENPRNLMATSVFWSGIFCLASLARPVVLQRSGLILGALIVLAYAISTNTISVDYTRLVQRQHLIASRMVERLSLQPGFSQLRTVVVVGSSPDLARDLRSKDQILPSLNDYIASGVLREVSGTPLQIPVQADADVAAAASRTMKSWPAPGSTAIKGDVGIVVLKPAP